MIVFDALLIIALVGLAAQALSARDPIKAVAMFVGFGLTMSIAWSRLGAPDVALAEAAIGAGVTGAIFMFTVRRIGRAAFVAPPARGRLAAVVGVTVAVPTLLVGWVVLELPPTGIGLRDAAMGSLDQSGVASPVTAVLLNFRGYDTLLELVVLLLAVMGVRLVWGMPRRRPRRARPALESFVRLIAPLMVVVAGVLLWTGAGSVGGAFQAGAVLAAVLVVLLLGKVPWVHRLPARSERLLLAVGPLVFLAAAVSSVLAGRTLLEYPPGAAGLWILVIEIAATVSIALILACLFARGSLISDPLEDPAEEVAP